jgi:hypothetical protein
MEESVEAFWARFEAETGEKVVSRSMAQYFSGPKDAGTWGLLVLSPTGLRFRPTPGQNWFASLFNSSPSRVSEKVAEDLVIPFGSMTKVEFPPRKFLDSLFGSPFLAVSIAYSGPLAEGEARFAVDPKGDFRKKIQELRS